MTALRRRRFKRQRNRSGPVPVPASGEGAQANDHLPPLAPARRAGRFDERATEAGFGRERVGGPESITWGTALADFDNDTDLDAYSAAGALGLESTPQDDALYENLGEGGFRPLTVSAPRSGRTVAPADWDGDGDVDLAVAQLGGPLLLLQNHGPRDDREHWLELRLIGSISPRDACGARIILRAAGHRQVRAVECRAGDRTVHLGLGADRRVEELRIQWPSGRGQVLRSLRTDRLLRVVEPRTERARTRRIALLRP